MSDPVPSLEEIYDDEVLALIEQYTRRPGAARQISVVEAIDPTTADVPAVHWVDDDGAIDCAEDGDWSMSRADSVDSEPNPDNAPIGFRQRFGTGGAIVVGAMLGVAEVFEPDRAKQTIIEFAPDGVDENQQLVTVVYVPGEPRASRLIIRPWLLAGRGNC
jgi:hypothetical protein